MWKWLEADDNDEYGAFVAIARSAVGADDLNARLAAVELPRLRDRMARLDEYAVRPLRIADPVRHLDNALGFVLAAMGRLDLADGLRRAPRTAAYRLVVGYMRAYLVRANEYCYGATEAELAAVAPLPQPVAVLREATFRRHMLGRDGPCAHLFQDDGGGSSSRWMGRLDRRRVRGAVRHIFADWETTAAVDHYSGRGCTETGLDMFLTYDQYERLARHGVIGLAPGGRRFTRASVPDDPAHAHRALLRSFVRVQYTAGYLDRLMRSLRRSFAPAFLEALAAAYALLAGGGGGGGHALDPNTVIDAARELDVPWFAEGTDTPEPADLYYAHSGFHPDL